MAYKSTILPDYEKSSQQSEASTAKEEYYKAFFYGWQLSAYSPENDKVISYADDYSPYTMADLRDGTNEGNCGPTAAANYCGYIERRYKNGILMHGSIQTTYALLVNAVGFERNGTGGTTREGFLTGLKSYIENRGLGFIVTMDPYTYSYWYEYKRDFDADKPVAIFITGNILENGSWDVMRHIVIGVGYRVMTDGTRYIRIYDGWTRSNSRFIKFSSNSITALDGVCITVSR